MFPRGGQHDGGNGPGAWIALDAPQHFKPVDLGQLEIKQDQARPVLDLALAVSPFAENKFQRFGAIARHMNAMGQVAFAQRPQRQRQIFGIIFNEQDLSDVTHGWGFREG